MAWPVSDVAGRHLFKGGYQVHGEAQLRRVEHPAKDLTGISPMGIQLV